MDTDGFCGVVVKLDFARFDDYVYDEGGAGLDLAFAAVAAVDYERCSLDGVADVGAGASSC